MNSPISPPYQRGELLVALVKDAVSDHVYSVACSPWMLERLGVSESEIINKPSSATWPDANGNRYRKDDAAVLSGQERKEIVEQLTVGDEDIDVVTDKHKVEGHSKLIMVLVYRGNPVYRFREKGLKNAERGFFVAAVDPALLTEFDPKRYDDIPNDGKSDWHVGDWQLVEGTDGFLAMNWENACWVVELHNQEILNRLRRQDNAGVFSTASAEGAPAAHGERESLKGKISHWLVAFPASYI